MTPDVEPELGWLVEGLLPVGYLTVLAGRPKDGKTCFAAALAATVSRGDDFAGIRTAKNKGLYFAAEEPPVEWEWAVRPWLGELDPKYLGRGPRRLPRHVRPGRFAGSTLELLSPEPAASPNSPRRLPTVTKLRSSIEPLCRGNEEGLGMESKYDFRQALTRKMPRAWTSAPFESTKILEKFRGRRFCGDFTPPPENRVQAASSRPVIP